MQDVHPRRECIIISTTFEFYYYTICPISNFTIPLKGQLHRTIFHLFIVNNFTNLFVPPLHGANTKLSKTLIIIIAKLFEALPFVERGWHFANVAAS